MKTVKTKLAMVIPWNDDHQIIYPLSLKAVPQALKWMMSSEIGSIHFLKEEVDVRPGFSAGHFSSLLVRPRGKYFIPTEVAKTRYYE